MKPFNQLSLAQAERLYLLSEELGEAVQAIGKILRHGYESYNPTIPHSLSNRDSLVKELSDIFIALDMMVSAGDINDDDFPAFMEDKQARVGKYLHHQG